MTDSAPRGIVVLMFTDIEDSSPLWEQFGDRFRPVLQRHNQLIRERIQAWDGYEVKNQGDSFMVAFPRGTDAVQSALDIQRALAAETWPGELSDLRIRIGIHAGEPFVGYDAEGRLDYFGPVVNRAARIAAAGHGGQILISSATRDIVHGALAEDVELLDLGLHRLRGLGHPEQLFEVRHPDLPTRQFPPPRTLDALRTSRPLYLTTFVGREPELVELRRRLTTPGLRLLTITGPGGAGKTRLAHEVAADCAGSFPDGVWLVNLTDVNEPEHVLPQITAALQLALAPHQDAREELLAFLRERSLLLVLDGCERVLGAALLLDEILRSAPRVRCLVTSRIVLGLTGEQVYPVPPLRAPDASITAPELLARSDSVSLFMERARAVRAEFELTEQNGATIAEICRQLEGIPLAIELAAAQVADMSVAEVLESLRAQIDLLRSESPDLPERHRTLRAALDGSYCLLSASEQTAMQQLSVFAGGCSREAAQAVLGAEGMAALRVLRRHSLLNTAETAAGRTHYDLLAMVREYARTHLDADPTSAEAARERHARYYLAFAEKRLPRMRTHEEANALADLREELDNLRAARDWAQQSGQNELCARLALALYEPLYRQGFWEEARGDLQAAGEALRGGGEARGEELSRLRAAVCHHLAVLAHDTGDLSEARRRIETSLELSRTGDDSSGMAEAFNLLGLLAMDEGDVDAAEQRLADALTLLGAEDHPRRGKVLHNLARLASRRGQTQEARRLYEEALGQRRAAGDARGEAETLANLGVVAHDAGDVAAARERYLASLALYRSLSDRHGIAMMLENLGELAEREGERETALVFYVHAERIFRELHSAFLPVPRERLQRLAGDFEERWASLRAAAEQRAWEDLLEEGRDQRALASRNASPKS